MKRILSLLLIIALLFTGCSLSKSDKEQNKSETTTKSEIQDLVFKDLSSQSNLEKYKEDVYSNVIGNIDNNKFFIEDIKATYVSQEYIDEINANSKENVYFGFTASELDEQFGETKYIFTEENGKTVVKEFEKFDDTYEQIIKNVAIGSGVILFCVTVSAVTGGLGTGAVSIIFAQAAIEGTKTALLSAGMGAIISGGLTYYETGDLDQSLKSASLSASEEFKWGAIIGSVTGGIKGKSMVKNLTEGNVTKNGLTLKEAAKIQRQSKYTPQLIKQIHSMDEYKIYKKAKLVEKTINGEIYLVKKIDYKLVSTLKDGTKVTNLERMTRGLAPVDKNGVAYQLHHIGQASDGSLAVLSKSEHLGNSKILHIKKESAVEHGSAWKQTREQFWKNLAETVA